MTTKQVAFRLSPTKEIIRAAVAIETHSEMRLARGRRRKPRKRCSALGRCTKKGGFFPSLLATAIREFGGPRGQFAFKGAPSAFNIPNTIDAKEAIMAMKKTAKIRRSPADIKKAWQKLEPELATQLAERERQGETFTSITRQEFEAKLKRVKSPTIVSQSWNNSASPGGTINYSVGVLTPDNVGQPGRVCHHRQSQSDRQ
jgi:hypothetical protein